MNLSQIENNKTVTVVSMENCNFSSKLYEFGLLPGVKIKVLGKASFNGPIYLEIDTYRFSIRKEEASFIVVR